MKTLRYYIFSCLPDGKLFFTKEEALSELELSQNQFQLQACRLYEKKMLKNLGHGFFMIIPPEHIHFGSLPPHWIIDPLMRYLEREYYIGLLSAASFYGATEQQPMTFQVVTDKQMRPIDLGRGDIEFHFSKNCHVAAKEQLTVPTGYANISTREQTMVDLVRYHPVCGYLANVAEVVRDLAEECQPDALAEVIEQESMEPVLQRLGYLLELFGYQDLAFVIEQELAKRSSRYTVLRTDVEEKEGMRLMRWKLILNDSLGNEL